MCWKVCRLYNASGSFSNSEAFFVRPTVVSIREGFLFVLKTRDLVKPAEGDLQSPFQCDGC